jgi:putative addiction module killer protein
MELRHYTDDQGASPFADWFSSLDAEAAAKIVVALARFERGLFGDCQPVGDGVSEHRLHWGPGYRVYFARDGLKLILLLTGGTKRRQQKDIETAKALWAAYKRRKGAAMRDARGDAP